MAEPIFEASIARHAAMQMERRGLPEAIVRQVLAAPGQREAIRPGRDLFQSSVEFPDGIYLVRVFVDVDRDPADVVTAYRTSKIAKYWRHDP